MIHPHTELRQVSPAIGYGMFATRPIPRGTITYVRDPFEREFSQEEFARIAEPYKSLIDRYCYTDRHGTLILGWDMSKYVNHSCESNTLLTAFGFDIAIRDIAAGEEITDDYGLFNIQETLEIHCGCRHCRHWLRPDDLETYHRRWDVAIQAALQEAGRVEQPLRAFMDAGTAAELDACLDGRMGYPSVMELKWKND